MRHHITLCLNYFLHALKFFISKKTVHDGCDGEGGEAWSSFIFEVIKPGNVYADACICCLITDVYSMFNAYSSMYLPPVLVAVDHQHFR